MELLEFLVWVSTGGGAMAIVSWVAERSVRFQELSPNLKLTLMIVLSIVFGLGAKLLIDFVPTEYFSVLADYFKIVYGILFVFVANQTAHKLNKKGVG